MAFTCHKVKRTDSPAGAIGSKMDVDRGGMQGFMTHKRFYGKQIGSVFIQVSAKSMAEGMTGEPPFPAQPVLVCMDMPGKEEGVDGSVPAALLWEKISHRPAAFKPVPGQQIQGSF